MRFSRHLADIFRNGLISLQHDSKDDIASIAEASATSTAIVKEWVLCSIMSMCSVNNDAKYYGFLLTYAVGGAILRRNHGTFPAARGLRLRPVQEFGTSEIFATSTPEPSARIERPIATTLSTR